MSVSKISNSNIQMIVTKFKYLFSDRKKCLPNYKIFIQCLIEFNPIKIKGI